MIVSCSKLSILLITLLLSFSNLFFNTQALWKIPSITVKQYPMSMSSISTYLYSHPVFRLRDTGSWSSLCFFLGWSAFLHILIILFPLSVFRMFLTQLFPSFPLSCLLCFLQPFPLLSLKPFSSTTTLAKQENIIWSFYV